MSTTSNRGRAECLAWVDAFSAEELGGEPPFSPPRQPPPRRRQPKVGEPVCVRCGALAYFHDATVSLDFCSPSCCELHRHAIPVDGYERACQEGMKNPDAALREAYQAELVAAAHDRLLDWLEEQERG
jgi:hypothetical protein